MGVMESNAIVKWRDNGLPRALSLNRLVGLFEDYGSQGLTSREISRMMGGKNTATRVMAKFPELRLAYQRGIDGRTIDAEAALLKRATGFTVTTKKRSTRNYKGMEEVTETEDDVYYPPDVAAIKLMLMNRERSRYSEDGENKPSVTIVFNDADKAL